MSLQRKALADIVTITRASTGTYFDSAGVLQTAGVDQPRIDYDPATLLPRGFLVEESRTNLFLRSAEFDDAAWGRSLATVTPNAALAPNGLTVADTLVATAASGEHFAEQAFSVTSGITYTVAAFVKSSGLTDIGLRFTVASLWGGASPQVRFDLSAGTATTTAGTIIQSSIRNIGNGWRRISMSASCTSSGATSGRIQLMSGVNNSFTGDGVSGVHLWGADNGPGAFDTSHIPTTSATVTRARDFAVISGAAFSDWFNPLEGTFVVEATGYHLANNRGFYGLSNGATANEMFGYFNASGNMYHLVASGGAFQGDNLQTGVVTAGTLFKTARSYRANDLRSATNGTLSTADTVAILPTGMDRMTIGHRGDAPTYGFPLNGHIRKVLYYPVALANAQLQTVTT